MTFLGGSFARLPRTHEQEVSVLFPSRRYFYSSDEATGTGFSEASGTLILQELMARIADSSFDAEDYIFFVLIECEAITEPHDLLLSARELRQIFETHF